MKTGPIVLIDDDVMDKHLLQEALTELQVPNELIWFDNCEDAWKFLKQTIVQPFMIICDINMPRITGIEFKLQIDKDPQLREKSIPFILHSTTADPFTIKQAYTTMTIQGFFTKPNDYSDIL